MDNESYYDEDDSDAWAYQCELENREFEEYNLMEGSNNEVTR